MSEDTRYLESCESLRFCEDFIGQPRDFPKKQTVSLPKPEAKPYSYEETWQAEHYAERAEKYEKYGKCCTCKRANGTPLCDYLLELGKKSLAHTPLEMNPANGCIKGYLCDRIKLYPNARRV